ncbi:uncharacterized protein LOC132308803 [Cornus florida]|uniref:uncharacterized protein LOC132308803 n=1 Tax=Cornus florida TaxID=4283 RepID=UPI00289D6D1E|nr:uncharacterized protein LOC132308803 [Cornus florida]
MKLVLDDAEDLSTPVETSRKLGDEIDDGEKEERPLDGSDDDDIFVREAFSREPTADELNWYKMQKGKPAEISTQTYSDSEDEDLFQEEMSKYSKQVKDSKGFDVDDFPYLRSRCVMGLIKPVLQLFTNTPLLETVNKLTKLAITDYNSKSGECYRVVKVVKANLKMVAGFLFYITFEAKIADDEQPIEFQAKALAGVEEDQVYSCCPKPTP